MTTSGFDTATDKGIHFALAEKVSVFIGFPVGGDDFGFIKADDFQVGKFLPEIEVTPEGHVYPVNCEGERTVKV